MQQHDLGPVEQIPLGEGREFNVNGTRVAVFRLRSGAVRAVQADCPHQKGPLADGLTGGDTVVCPFHAWKFDLITGKATTVISGEACIDVYPVSVTEKDTIRLTMSSRQEAPLPCSGPCIACLP